MIKPIETRYKGFRFRSRLEARWAVFFDAVGIEWDYEPEGFEVGSKAYLPDFWLPELGIWYEIKGTLTWKETNAGGLRGFLSPELRLMQDFRDKGVACCLSEGLPGWRKIHWFGWDANESSAGASEDYGHWIISDKSNQAIIRLEYMYSRPDKSIYNSEIFSSENELRWVHEPEAKRFSYLINNAYNKAKSARFEYGESG